MMKGFGTHSRTGWPLRAAWWASAAALVLALAAGQVFAAEAATWSFGAGDKATCPGTVAEGRSKIAVDLSALPAGAKVFRAVLRCSRTRGPGWQRESDKVVVVPAAAPDKPLALLGPRYSSLDATAAVAAALADGKAKVEFLVKSLSGMKRGSVRLDVSFVGGKAKGKLPKVTGLAARHRGGQTIITWTQPEPGIAQAEITFEQWRAIRRKPPAALQRLRYRIYRSAGAITAATIAKAELIDEVGPLTCWNAEFHGLSPPAKAKLLRYVAVSGDKPVPPGTGIYAHNPRFPDRGVSRSGASPAKAGKAYYAVTCSAAGEENLTAFDKGNCLSAAVDEKVGPGEPILQRIEKPEKFFYTKAITLYYYTRWEAPPRCNLPSRPYDYLVTVPDKVAKPAPLNLILHCWGSNLYGKGGAYSWHSWKDKTRGIGVASNQIPYDWWTCYHENRGTWRPWTEGLARNFTSKRLLAFVDWVSTKWQVDQTRLVVSGESMGGSGSTFMPIRYPKRFAYAYSAVGIHNPAAIKGGFHESYARCVGRMAAKLKHESGMGVWDYLNDPLLVRRNPKANLPFIGFGNGKNDHGIGWPHAVDLANALQEARQPHAVVWRLRGHGSGTFYPPIDFRSDQSLPAFTRCSLDDDIGTATRLKEPKPFKLPWGQVAKDIYDGDHEGGINVHLRWKTDDVTDEPDTWEMTVFLTLGKGGAPADACTVNITPRRCQKFQAKPGMKFKWTNHFVKGMRPAQRGTAVADKHGLVTMKKVIVTKGPSRIRLVRAK